MQNIFNTPIEYLKGVGPQKGEMMRKELQIHCYGDLVQLFPNRYLDRTKYYKINELQESNTEIQIIGKIIAAKSRDEVVLYTRILDRLLRAGYYHILTYGKPDRWFAYWDIYQQPKTKPKLSVGWEYWWVDAKKAKMLNQSSIKH